MAATALKERTDAALRKSVEITTDNQSRSKALITAGAVLVRVRKYQEGAAMFAEGAAGQTNESQLMRSSTAFAKTHPYESLGIVPTDPRSVVQHIYGQMLSGRLTLEEYKSLLYDGFQDSSLDQGQFRQMMSGLKAQLSGADLPLLTVCSRKDLHLGPDRRLVVVQAFE